MHPQTPYHQKMSPDNQITMPTGHAVNGQAAMPLVNGQPATAPPLSRRRWPVQWGTLGAYVIGGLGLGFAVIAMLLLVSVKGSDSAQFGQMRQQLTTDQAKITSLSAKLASQASEISNVQSQLNSLISFTTYNQVCSVALDGQNGPANYNYPCAQAKSGG